ncbi:helix-turn-helix transcriptional regulator [Pseudoalteromonas sp. SCSIO 43095]|uniref:helix-turn-helix transcriptional regulator n=1 Tax=Pseudoalteromonas TaxID=53246 RepID=UPI00044C130F|nr:MULTISPECIES: helix-turn-helix transcriptional regulator [Pseudoalteromonas]EWS98978.1 transcriptional regulator [Pseudoalteromonas sp. SCSIO_11900]MBT2151844.1 helix-turn-helix transcriptional regulator [Pseudoalteromonas tetraodonis]MCK8104177.1 helix-turn-helix transcriptional regulator [Pseudoalteromonas sp. 2CM36K]MCK8137002.1 helix-turn-helix transcriptional regulator [Pseudoalteromonas sp. 2CM28B]MDN3489185.1 helix-turn-helix transcriptional regulator [Pseudoalteromonas sp. APC 3694]
MQNNIAKFRKEAGLSQQELADAINVSRKTISTVETNRFTPSVIIALKIARHFNTSVESLFTLQEHD